MRLPQWRDVIIRAMHALGGDAPYSKLKPEIERRAERPLTDKWHQTVEGTIEQFSSDSARGPKPSNFRGSDKDIFRKIGHGHWGIRDAENPFVRQALKGFAEVHPDRNRRPKLSSSEPEAMVFVREHWRRYPGDGETDGEIEAMELDLRHMQPRGAWVTGSHLEVDFQNGFSAKFPLVWFTRIATAPRRDQADLEIRSDRLIWPRLQIEITVARLFFAAAQQA